MGGRDASLCPPVILLKGSATDCNLKLRHHPDSPAVPAVVCLPLVSSLLAWSQVKGARTAKTTYLTYLAKDIGGARWPAGVSRDRGVLASQHQPSYLLYLLTYFAYVLTHLPVDLPYLRGGGFLGSAGRNGESSQGLASRPRVTEEPQITAGMASGRRGAHFVPSTPKALRASGVEGAWHQAQAATPVFAPGRDCGASAHVVSVGRRRAPYHVTSATL